MKVHLLYLKTTRSLYGISIQNDIVDRFLSERNSKSFIHKTKKMDKDKYNEFLKVNNNRNRILSEYPFNSG